jgi:hypothetical protein
MLRRLWKDEEGSILILFTLLVFVMMGMVGLAIEGGRVLGVDSQLQDLADAAALAGARELDGSAGAMARAEAVARTLLSNSPPWAEGGPSAPDAQLKSGTTGVQFYEKLKGVDGAAVDEVATDARYARFIQVTTVDRAVLAYFLRAVGATNSVQRSATATAGSGIVACEVMPLMMCNPTELTSGNFTINPGQMLQLIPKGSTGGFSPGDFGLLDPPGYTNIGAPDIARLLSKRNAGGCYWNQISPRTGHATNKVQEGINIRFDRYGNTSEMDMTVAPTVIDGKVPRNASCQQYDDAVGQKLPRDEPLTTLGTGVKIGNGPTAGQLDAYWADHHVGARPAGLTTRYAIYLNELGLDANGDSVTPPAWKPGSEPSAPTCYSSNGGSIGDYKRRVMRAAVVDCQHWDVRGNSINNIWSNQYAEFFLTEPSGDGGGPESGTLFFEFIRFVTPETSGGEDRVGLARIVQLYR